MADSIKYTWNDSMTQPVEGSFECDLPAPGYFDPPGDGVDTADMGFLPKGMCGFTLHGIGVVESKKFTKAGPVVTTRNVTDDSGEIYWAHDAGNGWMHFKGRTEDGVQLSGSEISNSNS